MKILDNKLRCDTELVCKCRVYCKEEEEDDEEEDEDDEEEKENDEKEEEEEGDALFQCFERPLFSSGFFKTCVT